MEEDDTSRLDDLAALGGLVRACQADQLEQEVCDRYAEELAGRELSQPGPSGATERNVDDFLHLPDSIKHGDLTPFELLKIQQAASDAVIKEEEPSNEDDHSLFTHADSTVKDEVNSDAAHEELPENELVMRNGRDEEEMNDDDDYGPSTSTNRNNTVKEEDEDDYVPSSNDEDSDDNYEEEYEDGNKGNRKTAKRRKSPTTGKRTGAKTGYKDDGDDAAFDARIRRYKAERELERINNDGDMDEEEDMKTIIKDLKVSASVWNKMYKYQKTGVRWLAELCEQRVGGILADEMGLGKTVQAAVFLRGLAESNRNESMLGFTGLGPSLLVCPATLLQQWVREMHTWHPMCRVAVLHSCGSHKGSTATLIRKMTKRRSGGSLLITSYSTFYNERKLLIEADWHYVILDEGHKIRNPEAMVTLAIKEVRTPYRVLLSGSPLQNSLKELWSLVDFVFPARLGSLKTFTEKFAIPITMGGYANASKIQTETAYKCSLVLRDAINPYFLRRLKKDVKMALDLPNKSEQVLFCDLAPVQRSLYQEYLSSRECRLIQSGRLEAFAGLILLRKLCNHPDLVTGGPNKHGDEDLEANPSMAYGWPERSGKMQVVRSLLQLWKKSSSSSDHGLNKVLLFSQSRRMLTVLEQMLILDGHSYLRMDGGTPIARRQQLINQFNQDPSMFVFLLTTRVGGVGVNLTAANKVLIFDPDWNPSTDAQARERAWRIGQKRPVTVYRLLTTGSIEEKMYHRQIFKQFLANRILKDPKQRRFLKTNHLHDLFTLTDNGDDGATDTGAIFSGETQEMTKANFFDKHQKEREKAREMRRKTKTKSKEEEVEDDESGEEEIGEEALSDKRRDELRAMAASLSRDLSKLVPIKRKRKSTEDGEIVEEPSTSRDESLFERRYAVPYLRKQKRAHRSKEEKEGDSKSSEDHILGELLSRNGIRSIVAHDEVTGEGKKRSDERFAEREADSVAKQAAAAIRNKPKFDFLQRNGLLKKDASGSSSLSSPSSSMVSPSFGDGQRLSKGKGGDLLEMIRARKRKQGDAQVALPTTDKYAQLAERVKEFLRECAFNVAKTERIVERFKREVSARDQLHFRSILKEIAVFDSVGREWQLKEEFR